ncbi:hypothetical protein VTI28DRAFT_4181 [Corynascus sepedonium]
MATNARRTGGASSSESSSSNCSKSTGSSGDEQPQQEQSELTPAQNLACHQPQGNESATLTSAASPQVFNPEMEIHNEYLYGASTDNGFPTDLTSNGALQDRLDGKDGLDEWLDIDCLLEEPTLPSYSNGSHDVELLGSGMVDQALVASNLDSALSACNSPEPEQYSAQRTRSGTTTPVSLSQSRDSNSGSNSSTIHMNTPLNDDNITRNQPRSSTMPTPQAYHDLSSAMSAIPATQNSILSWTQSGDRPVDLRVGDRVCCCLQVAACLVEDLGAKAAAGNRATMDVHLGDFRGALAQYGNILDCKRCAAAREINMLLAMAAKYMGTLCERIVVCYTELKRTQGRHYPPVSANSSWDDAIMVREGSFDGFDNRSRSVFSKTVGRTDGLMDEIRFSTYRIESNVEKMHVLRSLVTVQVTEFGQMLARLKKRPGIRRGHLALLTEARGKVHVLELMLRGSLDDSLAGGMHDLY